MITRDERRLIHAEFGVVLAGQTDPKALITTIFQAESSQVLQQLPLTLRSPDEYAAHVVGHCLASRWSCTPALLDLLLDYLVNTKGIGKFTVILTRVRNREDPNPNAYESAWLGLSNKRPFFDRADLRDRVRNLIEDNARPLLRVIAPPQSYGRTYSRRFLEHLEDVSPGDTHVLAEEISPGTGPSYQVVDLADACASQLGVTDPIPSRSGSSYSKAIARWVLKHLMSRGDRWIIVLDGFGQEGLNPEVRETIEALAAMIPVGQFRQRVRLVLLDYPEELPAVSTADILEEILQPADALTKEDLEPCIIEWDGMRRAIGKPGLPPQEILALAAGIFERAPVAGRDRLEAFHQDLSKLLQLA